jgi:hypothetical protein
MQLRRRVLLAAALMVCLGPGVFLGIGQISPSTSSAFRTFFTARSAKLDETLGDAIRNEFEDDDGSPLKSVAIDLNEDGKEEKFVFNSVLTGTGGSQWLVYDVEKSVVRGIVVGAIIFVERQTNEGWPRLETYWKQGGDMAVVFNYTFVRGKYVRVRSRSLTVPEIDAYFRTKPPIDLEQELVEIKVVPEAPRRAP